MDQIRKKAKLLALELEFVTRSPEALQELEDDLDSEIGGR